MPGKRREAFEAYYKANPDKLKGKTVDEAYAAMRRNVIATGNKTNKLAGDRSMSAIERRLAASTTKSRVSPLAKGAAGFFKIPGKIVDALPDPGFGSQRAMDKRRNKNGSLGEQWNKSPVRKALSDPLNHKERQANYAANKAKANGMSEAQKNALERRLRNKSSKGGRQA